MKFIHHLPLTALSVSLLALNGQAKEPLRDPFWPVGFKVEKPQTPKPILKETLPNQRNDENVVPDVVDEEGILSADEKTIVTGKIRPVGYLQRGQSKFLYINGEMLTTGEKLIVKHNGKKHAFTITEFKDRTVVLKAHWNFTEENTDSEN